MIDDQYTCTNAKLVILDHNATLVGSDSHTGTAGAFNALAAGIDLTETAGFRNLGETWLRVPDKLMRIFQAKGQVNYIKMGN